MLIACKCLNIILHSANKLPLSLSVPNDNDCHQRESNLPSVNLQPVHLQQCTIDKINGEQLQFFKAANPITTIAATTQHSDLVQATPIEDWNLHLCVNCKTITYAQSANDNNIFLIDSTLLTNQEEINMKKNHDSYSKTFGIVIRQHSEEIIRTQNSDRHANLSARSKNLKQHLRDVIQKEIEATDERIRRYTEHQTALLKVYREKAEQDYQDLISVLSNVPDLDVSSGQVNEEIVSGTTTTTANTKLLSDLDTPPVTPDSTPMSIGNSPNFKQQPAFMTNVLIKTPISKATEHSSPYRPLNVSDGHSESADADIFFEMDGLDGADALSIGGNNQRSYDTDGYDNADEDDDTYDSNVDNDVMGVKITSSSLRPPRPKVCIAQSLPMAVPIFSQRADDDYEEYADDNVDIAASIKALAKSVHGEAVFGDLPRPRFSTQI